jgi:hypothetical protein
MQSWENKISFSINIKMHQNTCKLKLNHSNLSIKGKNEQNKLSTLVLLLLTDIRSRPNCYQLKILIRT